MANKQRGRPPLPVDQIRSQRVVTFVTEGELAMLQRLADRQNMTISTAVHQLISKELGT